MREREYILTEQEFKGKAFRKNNRTVRVHSCAKDRLTGEKTARSAMITLPVWMLGQEFDIILIPKENKI